MLNEPLLNPAAIPQDRSCNGSSSPSLTPAGHLRREALRCGESRWSPWPLLWQAEQQHPRLMAAVAVLPGVLFLAGGAVLTQSHPHVPVLAGISLAVGAVWMLGATLHIRANCQEARERREQDRQWDRLL
ncbi:hypothetical protein [Cupriavidus sp. AU9028]|uniref:hypothetical protein n=1 Tax=Cupriavidus sp. AU9028 TaxID=2871157 RepID=UPI001C958E40|nr:hypothetical protein [Cupriavidus sp. AU9028]MBY4896148.1 hypothetical protein [Cupriavidus sp. AU9028]